MKVLITGGAGFLGSHLAASFCREDGVEVRVLDDFHSGHPSNLHDLNVVLIEGTVEDSVLCEMACRGVDYVFHFASLVGADDSVARPTDFAKVNTQGTLNLVRAASEFGVKKLIHASTSAVYGSDLDHPPQEEDTLHPLSPYAATKLDSEHYVDFYGKQWSLPTVSLRYCSVFGPRQDPDSPYASDIPRIINQALRHQDIRLGGDSRLMRDYLYVEDVVQANRLVMARGEGVYNLASGESRSIHSLAERIVLLTHSRSRIICGVDRHPSDPNHPIDNSRILGLGFRPTVSFRDALADTVAYYRALDKA